MFPWYSMTMLAFEASDVIGLRLMKLSSGDKDARQEAELMIHEKIGAAVEANATLAAGGSFEQVVDRYRQHVAANRARLVFA